MSRLVCLGIALVADMALAQDPAPRPTAPIETRRAPGEDRAIATRLREIYAQVDGLADVRVDVAAGVVRLRGDVLSSATATRAEGIAQQLQGVVGVESEIVVARDVERRLRPRLAALRERALDAAAMAPLIGLAVLLVGVSALAGWLLTAWDGAYRRLVPNRFLRDLVRGTVRTVVTLAGVFLALEILEATTIVAALAGAAGVAGLAIGFGFRDLAENYIASVLLAVRQPFLPNDHVVIEAHEGHVARLTSRATILIDLEGNHVRIPNALVFKGITVNYTRSPRRRFDFTVGVDTEADVEHAQTLGLETLRTASGVLGDPPPQVWIDELGDSNVILHFFGWVDQGRTEWAKTRGHAIRSVKEAFDVAGVAMPAPIVSVRHIDTESPPPPVTARSSAPVDLAPERHLEREIAADRAGAGGDDDLLDPRAPRE